MQKDLWPHLYKSLIFSVIVFFILGLLQGNVLAYFQLSTIVYFILLIGLIFGWYHMKDKYLSKGSEKPIASDARDKLTKKQFLEKRKVFFADTTNRIIVFIIIGCAVMGLVTIPYSVMMGVLFILTAALLMHFLRRKFTQHLFA